MSEWRKGHERRAVRPQEVEDVEREPAEGKSEEAADEDEEGERGEEPGVVEPPEEQKPGGKIQGQEVRRMGPGEEGARMRNIGDPRRPSAKEVDERYLTHVPYRNWCPHCVRGRGKDLDHRKGLDEDRSVREFSFDYCFPGDEKGKKLTVLVEREESQA